AILAPVKTINLGGHSALTLDNSTDPVARNVTLDVKSDAVGNVTGDFGTITGLTPAKISVRDSDITSLVLRGGNGGNTFTVANTISAPSCTGTILNAGSGDDTINVLRTGGPLTVDVQGNFSEDLVTVGDAGSVQGIQGALTVATNVSLGFYELT